MAISTSKRFSGSSNSTPTLQNQVLDHFFGAMNRLQEILIEDYTGKDPEDQRWQAFSLQMMYIRKLLPNREVQDSIRDSIGARTKEYIANETFSSKRQAEYAAHMETLTEVMIYLNTGMDLIHNDIAVALTQRAAEHAREPIEEGSISA